MNQIVDKHCRLRHKHCTNHYHQQARKKTHHKFSVLAKIQISKLMQTAAVVFQGHITRQEVMHCTHENTAKRNPKESHRAIRRPQYCTEYWSKSGNVQQLYQKYFPTRKRNVVNTVITDF